MRNLSITFKFAAVMLLSLGLLAISSYLLLSNVYRLQIRSQANTVADNVTSFGNWVAKYGQIWVQGNGDQSFLSRQSVVGMTRLQNAEKDNLREHAYTLFSKNPALAQRELSEVVAESESPAKFKLTSDNYMNPLNTPNSFERSAISYIKRNNANYFERFDSDAGQYLFARKVVHKPSCIRCHGNPNDAPADVIDRYGRYNGFGFKAGDVAGIISVRLPLRPFFSTVVSFIGWKEISLVLAAFAAAMWFLHRSILLPIRRLTDLADGVSTGRIKEFELGTARRGNKNEVDRLGVSIKRLSVSTNIAMHRLKHARKHVEASVDRAKADRTKADL